MTLTKNENCVMNEILYNLQKCKRRYLFQSHQDVIDRQDSRAFGFVCPCNNIENKCFDLNVLSTNHVFRMKTHLQKIRINYFLKFIFN